MPSGKSADNTRERSEYVDVEPTMERTNATLKRTAAPSTTSAPSTSPSTKVTDTQQYTADQWAAEESSDHSNVRPFITSENIAMSNIAALARYLHPSTFQLASKMKNDKRLGLKEMLKFAKEVALDATNLQSESDEGESGGAAPDGSFNVDWAAENDASTTNYLTLTQNYTSYRQSFKGVAPEGFNFPAHLVGLRESDSTGKQYGPWPILGLMHGAKRLGESYCERMGSIAGSIVTADRTRLDDKTLEILILLKMNKELYIEMEKMVKEGTVDIDFAAVADYFGDFEKPRDDGDDGMRQN